MNAPDPHAAPLADVPPTPLSAVEHPSARPARSPLWVVLLLLAALALTLRLGVWQLDRAAQKNALTAALQARAAAPPLDEAGLPRHAEAVAEAEHRTVVLTGRWLDEASVVLDHRSMQGRTGFYLLTPLMTREGSVVLVQRGWLPRDAADRSRVPWPTAAPAAATVTGRIARAASQLLELGDPAVGEGRIRQNVAIDAYAAETGLKLLPWVLVQTDPSEPGPLGLQRQWPQVASDVHKHYGYAAQWFALAALTAGFGALLAWRRWRPAQSAA